MIKKIDSLKNNFELLDAAETVKQAVITQYNTELQTRFVAEDTFRQHQQQERKQEIKKFGFEQQVQQLFRNFLIHLLFWELLSGYREK